MLPTFPSADTVNDAFVHHVALRAIVVWPGRGKKRPGRRNNRFTKFLALV